MIYDKTHKRMNHTARIIVLGNEKGGSGKSTTAMHLAIGLLYMGYRVATIDLDARQGSLTRYLANRFEYISASHIQLPSPTHIPVDKSYAETLQAREKEDRENLCMIVDEIKTSHDFIIFDTPGSESYLSLVAHAMAHIAITPLNDSFVDLDVIARVDPMSKTVKGPSIYSRIVQQTREFRPELRWIVMRNRLSSLGSKNKSEMAKILRELSHDFRFELGEGFTERVVFRELFLQGLTLLDLSQKTGHSLTLSELTARQEVRSLLSLILEGQK